MLLIQYEVQFRTKIIEEDIYMTVIILKYVKICHKGHQLMLLKQYKQYNRVLFKLTEGERSRG